MRERTPWQRSPPETCPADSAHGLPLVRPTKRLRQLRLYSPEWRLYSPDFGGGFDRFRRDLRGEVGVSADGKRKFVRRLRARTLAMFALLTGTAFARNSHPVTNPSKIELCVQPG
jgi:hypothetical protein